MGKGRRRGKKRKRKKQKPRPNLRRMSREELDSIIDRARTAGLSEADCNDLEAVIDTLAYITEELAEKNLTLARLRAIFGLSTSEKMKDVLPRRDADKKGPGEGTAGKGKQKKKPRKGHGRNSADEYTGAEIIEVPHESLSPGSTCPTCEEGKVYARKDRPKTLVRISAQEPLGAKVYRLETFRCNRCGATFVAEPPEGVGDEKYDAKTAAMIALLRYGCGLPFNRLEGLERNFGIPLPASVQWELVRDAAKALRPVLEEMIRLAAQGRIVHNDDTNARILERIKEVAAIKAAGREKEERTGTFTTGIQSVHDDYQIALYFTGRDHAGENLTKVLKYRDPLLGLILQMSDALDRNKPKGIETITSFCLCHARRKFVKLAETFPSACEYVLTMIGSVYRNEAHAKEGGFSDDERLAYHQENSQPIMDRLREWMDRQFEERLVEPNSSLGEAIEYMTERWDELTMFLRLPGAPLDNNAVERRLKLAIRHRSNSLFYKSQNGADTGDLFMSLLATAELAGANPFEYLVALIEHPEQIAAAPGDWMPWNYTRTLEGLSG